jgi:hypothetical protein
MPSFWMVKLMINKQAIVITAGFENPDNPSSIDSNPVSKSIPKIISADTSTGKTSVEKRINATATIAIIINISNDIYGILYISASLKNTGSKYKTI